MEREGDTDRKNLRPISRPHTNALTPSQTHTQRERQTRKQTHTNKHAHIPRQTNAHSFTPTHRHRHTPRRNQIHAHTLTPREPGRQPRPDTRLKWQPTRHDRAMRIQWDLIKCRLHLRAEHSFFRQESALEG